MIHGKSSQSVVRLKITATGYIKADEGGKFSYSYKISSIPPGEFVVSVGGITKVVALAESSASSTPSSSSGGASSVYSVVSTSTPTSTPQATPTATLTPAPTTILTHSPAIIANVTQQENNRLEQKLLSSNTGFRVYYRNNKFGSVRFHIQKTKISASRDILGDSNAVRPRIQ